MNMLKTRRRCQLTQTEIWYQIHKGNFQGQLGDVQLYLVLQWIYFYYKERNVNELFIWMVKILHVLSFTCSFIHQYRSIHTLGVKHKMLMYIMRLTSQPPAYRFLDQLTFKIQYTSTHVFSSMLVNNWSPV